MHYVPEGCALSCSANTNLTFHPHFRVSPPLSSPLPSPSPPGSYFVYDNPAALQCDMMNVFAIDYSTFMLQYSLYSWPNVVLSMLGGYLIDKVFGIRCDCSGGRAEVGLGSGGSGGGVGAAVRWSRMDLQ